MFSDGPALDPIRAALIAAFIDVASPEARLLRLRVQHAGDAELLWNLRPAVMSAIASLHGEAHARELLARISPLFQDVLPDGLACKLRVGRGKLETA